MTRLFAVLLLTISQFTAFPFIAMVAANTARHSEVQRAEVSNVTIVYKTDHRHIGETIL